MPPPLGGESPGPRSPGNKRPTNPWLQSAIEVTSDTHRIEWQVSQLLTSHQAALEVMLSDQQVQASREADQRVACVEQRIGRLGDDLAKRLDGLHVLATGARKASKQSSGWRDNAEEAVFKEAVSRMQEMEKRMEAMQRDLLRWRVHELHEQLHNRHEEAVRMQAQHADILQDLAQQVKALTAARTVRFERGAAGSSVDSADEKQTRGTLERSKEGPPEDGAPAGVCREEPGVASTASRASSAKGLAKSASTVSAAGHWLEQFGNSKGGAAARQESQGRQMVQGDSMGIDVQTLQCVQGWHRGRSPKVDPRAAGLKRFQQTMETISSVLIVSNILYMGVETEFSMASVQNGQQPPHWLWYVSLGFAIAFSVELVLRISVEKWAFFNGPQWRWNLFDTSLVLVQVVDIAFAVINLTFIRAFRCVRSLRALRVIRTVSFVRELRLMIASISASFTSLMWSFVLLLLTLYLFSLGLEQTIQAHLEIAGAEGLHPRLKPLYGSLGSAMVTLFMAISGGMDWSDLVEPLLDISWAYRLFFIGFITFTLFGMLNILTAIFVEATSKIAEVDQDLVIQGHLDHESSVIGKVREYLSEADMDGSGTISKEEFEAKLADPHFQAQLNILDLDPYEARGVFRILNISDADAVGIEEFIYGLIRLKGTAKAVDVVTMLCESRRIAKRLAAFMSYTENSFNDLRFDLGLVGRQGADMKTYLDQTSAAQGAPKTADGET